MGEQVGCSGRVDDQDCCDSWLVIDRSQEPSGPSADATTTVGGLMISTIRRFDDCPHAGFGLVFVPRQGSIQDNNPVRSTGVHTPGIPSSTTPHTPPRSSRSRPPQLSGMASAPSNAAWDERVQKGGVDSMGRAIHASVDSCAGFFSGQRRVANGRKGSQKVSETAQSQPFVKKSGQTTQF